jgi:predicted Zn-dependent protease
MKRQRHFLPRFFLFLLPILLLGCAEMVQVGTTIGEGMGKISPEDKARLDRMAVATAKAVRPMTEREEYYVGRAVAATILSQYRIYTHQPSTRYLNEVGQAVALASDRPLTYGGYHFAILDSQEVNAMACPGGIIFVTRGALRRASNEEELAAILAHEVAHVNHKDGLASIQHARWVEAVSLMGAEAAQKLGGADLAKLVSLFQESVNDVVKTILVKGYSREQEMAADSAALLILPRLRYDPHGLTDYLERIAREQKGGSPKGIFSTHPGMAERLAAAQATISEKKWTRLDHRVRDQRFQQSIKP